MAQGSFINIYETRGGGYNVTAFVYDEKVLRAYEVVKKTVERAGRSVRAATVSMTLLFAGWGVSLLSTLFQPYSQYWIWMVVGFGVVSIAVIVATSLWAWHREREVEAIKKLYVFEGRILGGMLRSDGVVTTNDYSMNRLAHHAWDLVKKDPSRAAEFFADPKVVKGDEKIRHRQHGNVYREMLDLLSYESRWPIVDAARRHFGVNEPFYPWMDELRRDHASILRAVKYTYPS